MTVRITRLDEPGQTRLRIDGWLARIDLPELERACADRDGGLVLDLTGLRDADSEALTRLRELMAAGAQLEGVSPYLALRLGRSVNRLSQGSPTGGGAEKAPGMEDTQLPRVEDGNEDQPE